MNTEMAYLLGLICGNGEIKRGATETTIAIDLHQHKSHSHRYHFEF